VQRDEFEAGVRGERIHGGIWQFLLEPISDSSTRLIMRGAAPDKASLLYDLVFDPAHFVMERKMMLGIKERAEVFNSIAPSSSSPESNPHKS
jgi:hypothetical protein